MNEVIVDFTREFKFTVFSFKKWRGGIFGCDVVISPLIIGLYEMHVYLV
jgi:hypothetical protein